jgi:hypothetical protein
MAARRTFACSTGSVDGVAGVDPGNAGAMSMPGDGAAASFAMCSLPYAADDGAVAIQVIAQPTRQPVLDTFARLFPTYLWTLHLFVGGAAPVCSRRRCAEVRRWWDQLRLCPQLRLCHHRAPWPRILIFRASRRPSTEFGPVAVATQSSGPSLRDLGPADQLACPRSVSKTIPP